jgi:hypothetical protein
VTVTKDRREERTEHARREPQARCESDAVGDHAAAAARLKRALVLPLPLAQHPRALEEAALRLEPHQGEVVVVDGQEAEEQDPASPDRLAEDHAAEIARPQRRRRDHAEERSQLGIDAGGARDPAPH